MTQDQNHASSYSDLYWTTQDGLQIAARRWSVHSPQASVLVVHGIGDHSGRFEHVAAFLNAAGYSVLVPDMRGHGRSDGKRGYVRDFDTLNDDIRLGLEQAVAMCPDRPVFVYGHSMGGLAALYFTLKTSPTVCGLIATSPALRVAMQAPAWKVSLGKALRSVLPKFSLDSGLDINELSDDPQVAERIKVDRYHHHRVTPGAYFGMVESGEWCLKNAGLLACPALLMHGKRDRITDHTASIEFADAHSECQLKLWESGKHELHNMTNRREVLAEITRFQSRCIREDCPSKD